MSDQEQGTGDLRGGAAWMDRLNNVRKRKRSFSGQALDAEDIKEQCLTELAPGLAADRQPKHGR
jgi:hypothetical protein